MLSDAIAFFRVVALAKANKICVSLNEDYHTWTISRRNDILSTQTSHQLEHEKRKTGLLATSMTVM
jgi:hypothetical protein